MRFISAIGQRGRKRLKKAARVFLCSVMLLAVAVGGLVLFSPEAISAWKSPGKAEQALSQFGIFAELLNFKAPAETVARFEANQEGAGKGKLPSSNDALLVENWIFTDQATDQATDILVEAWILSETLFLESAQLLLLERFLDTIPGVNQAQLNAFFNLIFASNEAFQNQLNSLIPPIFRPPAIASLSPFK